MAGSTVKQSPHIRRWLPCIPNGSACGDLLHGQRAARSHQALRGRDQPPHRIARREVPLEGPDVGDLGHRVRAGDRMAILVLRQAGLVGDESHGDRGDLPAQFRILDRRAVDGVDGADLGLSGRPRARRSPARRHDTCPSDSRPRSVVRSPGGERGHDDAERLLRAVEECGRVEAVVHRLHPSPALCPVALAGSGRARAAGRRRGFSLSFDHRPAAGWPAGG